MADPFAPVLQALSGAAALTAIVSDRITPLTKPQAGEHPAITLQLVDNEPENHLQGTANLDHARVQVEYWAADYDTALDLANKGRAVVSSADRMLIFEIRDYDFDAKLYRFAQDYSVWI